MLIWLQILCAVQVHYLTQQSGYISDKCDQKEAQVRIVTSATNNPFFELPMPFH